MPKRKFSIVIPDDLTEWMEYRAYEQRTTQTGYIVGQIRADYEASSTEEKAKFEAARAGRVSQAQAQGDADEAAE